MFIHCHRRDAANVFGASPHDVRKARSGGRAPSRAGHAGWLRLAAAGAALPLAVLVTPGAAQARARPATAAVTGTRASLTAVTAIPGSSGAWAVGQKCPKGPEGCVPGNDEILRESGGAWSPVAAPSPGGQASLVAVSADSASDAWAVGSYDGGEKNLYLHWTHGAWQKVNGPTPDGSTLTGVAAISPDDALAVGSYTSSTGGTVTLGLHWNGRSWTKVATPDPTASTGDDTLLAVTAIPGSTGAWAAGYSLDPQSRTKTLVLHWNGTRWSQVASPPVATFATQLAGVAAVSSSDAWAVGQSGNELNAYHPLALHWSHGVWSQQKLPSLGGNHILYGVAATASDVWAVGYGPCVGPSVNCPSQALTMHLTSSRSKVVSGVSVSDHQNRNTLAGVAITSGSDVWAVGDYFPAADGEPIFALLEKQQGSGWVTR
jgi:hypothetical protein